MEKTFWVLKSKEDMAPVWHHLEPRMRAYFFMISVAHWIQTTPRYAVAEFSKLERTNEMDELLKGRSAESRVCESLRTGERGVLVSEPPEEGAGPTGGVEIRGFLRGKGLCRTAGCNFELSGYATQHLKGRFKYEK